MHSHEKGQQVGSRAFRCEYEGCGRLYTTAHHLKVRQVTVGAQIHPCLSGPGQNAELWAWLPKQARLLLG